MISFDLEMFKIISIPIISAFIGWLTNWIAIKMLFHPQKPIKILFFTLQGIFYRKQQQFAHKLSHTIESKLFSHKDIQKTLNSLDFQDSILHIMKEYIDDFIDNRLGMLHPLLKLIPSEMLETFKQKLLDEFKEMIPKFLNCAQEGLEKNLNVKELIHKKIEAFEVSELENIIFAIMKSEFKYIEYIGGILGFFIGLTQLGIFYII